MYYCKILKLSIGYIPVESLVDWFLCQIPGRKEKCLGIRQYNQIEKKSTCKWIVLNANKNK